MTIEKVIMRDAGCHNATARGEVVSQSPFCTTTNTPGPMAENIYSKGTRVWFEDKDHAWISGEVTSITKSADGSIKLVFQDDRGKVRIQ